MRSAATGCQDKTISDDIHTKEESRDGFNQVTRFTRDVFQHKRAWWWRWVDGAKRSSVVCASFDFLTQQFSGAPFKTSNVLQPFPFFLNALGYIDWWNIEEFTQLIYNKKI